MKQAVTLRLGQHLTMTPALQQAIRLLQLSTLDLSQEIQDVLDANPLLEREDDTADAGDSAAAGENGQESEERREGEQIPDDLPVDADWDDIYAGSAAPAPPSGDGDESAWEYRQSILHEAPSLQDHLLWQAGLSGLDQTQETIAAHIIDLIDEDGYLHDWDGLLSGLCDSLSVTAEQVEAVLAVIQAFDPPGVAARNLGECLGLQIEQLAGDGEDVALARTLIERHLDQVAHHKLDALAQRTGAATEAVSRAIQLIQSLNPRPGSPFSSQDNGYVVPEVLVTRREGSWLVSLNSDALPRLRINPFYQSMIRRADKSEDQVFLKNNLQEARYFLNSLKSRNETLLRVAQCIVEEQRPFLEYGEEAMRPLVLRDVAGKLGVHESTVSRATSNKYMLTPRGLYELKYFFSSGVGTTHGGTASATAIQAMIRRLVQNEQPSRPLSDSRLTQLLLEEGIKVARRTVAKYREAINIPPSHERRRGA